MTKKQVLIKYGIQMHVDDGEASDEFIRAAETLAGEYDDLWWTRSE